jgi:DNA polymerase
MDGDFLRMVLPSGRTLAYHKPQVNAENKLTFMAQNPITHKWEREDTWGGKLVENMTQAVARDIMVEAMFRLIKTYRILFTIHDELVLESKAGSVSDVLKHVRVVPPWATGCPINAECTQTERYQK